MAPRLYAIERLADVVYATSELWSGAIGSTTSNTPSSCSYSVHAMIATPITHLCILCGHGNVLE